MAQKKIHAGLSESATELTPEQTAAVRSASAWVQQFARTLKTCRLYDRNNPTVVRFREDLSSALVQSIKDHGSLALTLTADDVLCHGVSLYPARSRDDNLGLPFYRDGIRALTFLPGLESHEIELLLDLVLRVTGPQGADEWLVTLLWDSGIDHLDISYVASDGDVESGGESDFTAADETLIAPWPKSQAAGAAFGTAPGCSTKTSDLEAAERVGRSDDRLTDEQAGSVESTFSELDQRVPELIERIQRDYLSDQGESLVGPSLGLIADCLEAGSEPGDRDDYAQFLSQVLREAIGLGLWGEARAVLSLLRRCESERWSNATFFDEMVQPTCLTTRNAVARLDDQDGRGIEEFQELTCEFGSAAFDWLMQLLTKSEQERVRRPLTRTIADLSREQPERLAPWLADQRWYVVRNAVHILAWIGGPAIVGLLRAASTHSEYRVRREVVAALAQAGAGPSRPLLLEMMESADSRIFCSVLHQLSSGRDRELASMLLAKLQHARFSERPDEERRAIYSALAAVGGDEVLPALEAELSKSHWFSKGFDAHRTAVARCIARINTEAANQILAAGLRARNNAVRKACEDALSGRSAA